MTSTPGAAEQAAASGLLGRLNETLPQPLTPKWEAAYKGVPRHRFLPETVWLGDELAPCDRRKSPGDWLRAAYADDPVVTQINDGADPQTANAGRPVPPPPPASSSACSTCWTYRTGTRCWRSVPGLVGMPHFSPIAWVRTV